MLDEEMTTVVNWPSFRLMTGPWVLASLAKDWCGRSPSKWRFPIRGKGAGPGGCFLALLAAELRPLSKIKEKSNARTTIRLSIIPLKLRVEIWNLGLFELQALFL